MHSAGREARVSHVQYQVVLYIYFVSYIWVTHTDLFGSGVCDEFKKTFAQEKQLRVVLLMCSGFLPELVKPSFSFDKVFKNDRTAVYG